MKLTFATITFLLLLALSACSVPIHFSQSNTEHYQLVEEHIDPPPSEKVGEASLLVAKLRAEGFTNSRKIVFSRQRGEMGYYRFAYWTEPPPKQLARLLISGIGSSSLFSSVSRLEGLVVGDFILNAELESFFLDLTENPAKARVRLNAEFISGKRRKVLASKLFDVSVKTEGTNAGAAVRAFSKATGILMREVIDWLRGVKTEARRNVPKSALPEALTKTRDRKN